MRLLAGRALLRACGALAALLTLLTTVLLIQHEHVLAHERDLRDASVVAEVLTTNPDAVRTAVSRTEAGRSGRLEVRLANGEVVGMTAVDPAVALRTSGGEVLVSAAYVPVPVVPIALVLLTSVVGVLGAVVLGLRPLRPVGRALVLLTDVAERGRGRVRVEGPRELQRLAEAVNAGADRTEVLLAKEREMIADVSHRLRTPLTALSLDVDAIEKGPVADRLRASVEALGNDVDKIIHSLRPAVSSDAPARCDLTATVAERMRFWSAHAEHQGRHCEVLLPDAPAVVPLAREEFGAVVDTLLGNVFQHTPPSAPVAVEVVRHAGWVTVVVEDGGTGFADPGAALRRGASGSGSTGLGLAIARSAAELAGGHVIVDKGRLGGARVRLRMAEAGCEPGRDDPRAWRLWFKRQTH